MTRIRLLLLLAALFACLSAPAAVEDRSPFRQGQWWNKARPGHGFGLLATSDQVFVTWYTYDRAGNPTWYTAQGARSTLGKETWTLQKHRWSDGRIVQSLNVGSMRLNVVHTEKIDLDWEVDGAPGKWTIEPFIASGVINEVDLTGHWYDPANSGWGLTLLDQGDVFGGVIYGYDPSGEPMWVAGFDRGKGTHIDLYQSRGTCPSCTYSPVATGSVGAIDVSHRGDGEITIRSSLSLALAAGLRVDGANGRQLGRTATMRKSDWSLTAFQGDAALRAYLAEGISRVQYSSGADFSPAPAAVDFSSTNTQEAGVDEADTMKSNGQRAYTLTTNNQAVRVAYVGGGSTLELRGQVPLKSWQAGASPFYAQGGLYLHGNDLVSLRSNGSLIGWYWTPSASTSTYVEVMSLADPDRPAVRWSAELRGALVSSRRVGDRLYVVTRFSPALPAGYVLYPSTDAQRAANRAVTDTLPLASLLPSVSVNGGAPVPSVVAGSVYLPPQGAQSPTADMVVVTAIDLAAPAVAQSLAILGRTETVYATPSNLYVASSRYELRSAAGALLPEPSLFVTDLHQVRLGANAMSLVASGSVEGTLGSDIDKSAFRLSELNGTLRVVSSTMSGGWGVNQANRLTILEPSATAPGLLKTVSWLPNKARPQTLGKPNEMLYGTRFVGDRLYAVTFKRIDPLYIVDLSNNADPKIAGELEIPGFSDYLHPLGNGLLLGFGKEATPAGGPADGPWAWFQGLQLTLFDVSGTMPRELKRIVVGKRGSHSALFQSHRAFSALTRADGSVLVGIPAKVHDGAPMYDVGTPSAWYPWDYSGLLRFELRGSTPANASLTQLPSLIAQRAVNTGGVNGPDDSLAWSYGRSILFPEASVYVGGDKLWRQDAGGNVTGPY